MQLVSTKPILCNNRFVSITIELNKMKYYINDATSNDNITEGVASNLHGIKKDIKNTLKSMGAYFDSEIRKPDGKLIIEG